jgi:hypothetical protein
MQTSNDHQKPASSHQPGDAGALILDQGSHPAGAGDLAWLCLNIREPLRQRDGESGSLFRERDTSRHQRSAWLRPSRHMRRAGCAVIPSRVRGQREPEFSRLHASTASIRILADALHWSPETCRAPATLRPLHHLPLIGEEEIS